MYGMGTKIRFGKKSNNHCLFYLPSSDKLLGYFPLFVVSKSQRIEVFYTGLVYYQWCSRAPSCFTVSAESFWEHPCQLKLGIWKAFEKALSSKGFRIETMLRKKVSFKAKQHFVKILFLKKLY